MSMMKLSRDEQSKLLENVFLLKRTGKLRGMEVDNFDDIKEDYYDLEFDLSDRQVEFLERMLRKYAMQA